jgi:hypothetical protein
MIACRLESDDCQSFEGLAVIELKFALSSVVTIKRSFAKKEG